MGPLRWAICNLQVIEEYHSESKLRRRLDLGHAMNLRHGASLMYETRIVTIELVAEIEELETKIAPSGAATLGDL